MNVMISFQVEFEECVLDYASLPIKDAQNQVYFCSLREVNFLKQFNGFHFDGVRYKERLF
jgi:hypothetical protein